MVKPNSTQVKACNFSAVFEQMCNFVAVSKTADPQLTIHGLIQLCLVTFPKEHYSMAEHFCSTIETVFGIAIPETQIEDALNKLEANGALSRPAGTNYTLSHAIKAELEKKINDAKNLEESVKEKWVKELVDVGSSVPLDQAWKALRAYLYRTFRRHGIQAAALLDPTVDTPASHDLSLSIILLEAIDENVDKKFRNEAKIIISGFLAQVGDDLDRSRYVAQLADAAFSFYTLAVPTELTDRLRKDLNELVLFLDTNFLFGITDLNYNSLVDVSHDLIRAIKKHKLPFKLRFHAATSEEMKNTIKYYGSILRSREWSKGLSRAAANSRYLSGIEQKFHEKNSVNAIDVDEFLRPYEHFDQLLLAKGIKIYRPSKDRKEAQLDLCSQYQRFLEKNKRGNKMFPAVLHDATVLDETRQLRTNAESSLEAGALLITCDYSLYRYDSESVRRKEHDYGCVLLPNIFWQILRPYIPADQDFEKAFAETFALPEFRILGSGGSKACTKMLGILASYKDVPEATAFKMLSNGLLLDRLKNIDDKVEFSEQVEAEFVRENNTLLEEKALLEQQLEAEQGNREREAIQHSNSKEEYQKETRRQKEELENIRMELEVVKRATEEHRPVMEEAKAHAIKAEKISGFLLGFVVIGLFEFLVHKTQWLWLLNHQNTIALQVGFSTILGLCSLSYFIKTWRAWCLGFASSIFVVLLVLLSGNESGTQ